MSIYYCKRCMYTWFMHNGELRGKRRPCRHRKQRMQA